MADESVVKVPNLLLALDQEDVDAVRKVISVLRAKVIPQMRAHAHCGPDCGVYSIQRTMLMSLIASSLNLIEEDYEDTVRAYLRVAEVDTIAEARALTSSRPTRRPNRMYVGINGETERRPENTTVRKDMQA